MVGRAGNRAGRAGAGGDGGEGVLERGERVRVGVYIAIRACVPAGDGGGGGREKVVGRRVAGEAGGVGFLFLPPSGSCAGVGAKMGDKRRRREGGGIFGGGVHGGFLFKAHTSERGGHRDGYRNGAGPVGYLDYLRGYLRLLSQYYHVRVEDTGRA